MAKLNKRQIIIIVITIVVILYGAYEWFAGGKKQKDTKEIEPVVKSNYLINITGDLMKIPVSLTDTYIVGRAEADWGKNPFWEKGSYIEWARKDDAKTKDDPESKIIYSGYVDAGKKKMAVINGLEYSVGEKLETGDYVLKKITATKVFLSDKSRGRELEVTIQD